MSEMTTQHSEITSKTPLLRGGWGGLILWFRIIRPQTLFASLVPVLIGLHVIGVNCWSVAIATVVCALLLQILSNLINDYYDFIRGTDKAGRAGFKRALAEGEVTEKAMRNACVITALLACVVGLYLVIIGGWIILAIGLSALLFAWLYTATSHSLSYLGIADIFVFLYYGVIASMGTVFLQYAATLTFGDIWTTSLLTFHSSLFTYAQRAFYGGAVSGLISMCVLMINNLRDYESDLAAGKKTLPVRFGKRTGEILMLVYVVLMPVFANMAFHSRVANTIFIFAFPLWIKVLQCKGAEYNKCLAITGMLNLLYYILCLIAAV